MRSTTGWGAGWGVMPVLLAVGMLPATAVEAQDPVVRTYLQGAACHFRFPASEVEVLSRWGLPEEEIPVVLFLSQRAGVSPEVILSLRRARSSWNDLSRRYGIGASNFHVPLGDAAPDPSLARAYGEFGSRSPRDWDAVTLSDPEVVALVNLRFLTEALGIPPGRVLTARASSGGWARAYASLGGRGC